MNTSIRMLHPRVLSTTWRSDDCYATFQEHTWSFLYSVNFSLVLTYPFFLETSRVMFFVVFFRQFSGTLEAEGSGTVTIRVAFRSIGIGFNVASSCVEVSEVRRAISSAFVRCFRVTRAAVEVLVLQPREEQRCVTGLLSITAQCFVHQESVWRSSATHYSGKLCPCDCVTAHYYSNSSQQYGGSHQEISRS